MNNKDITQSRKIENDKAAVSPVIGVILMVAITVVLAAIVFVVVSNLSHGGINAPVEIGVNHNQDNTFSIVSISEKIAWNNVTIKDNGITQSFTVNGGLFTTGQVISAGDVIKVSGLTAGNHNVSMITRNTVFYQTSFIV